MSGATTHSGGFRLLLRARAPAAALVLLSVYVERVLQAGHGSVLTLDIANPSALGEALAWYVVAAAGAALFSAPALAVIAARARGATATLEQVVRAAAGAWRLWLASLAYAVGTAGGAALLLFPGLFLSVAWVLYGPAAVVGGAGPVRALGRSYGRVRRHWGRTAALIAGPFIVYGVVYAIGVVPQTLAGAHYVVNAAASGAAVSSAAAEHALSHAAPAWFEWVLMPLLFTFARLYLFAAVVAAWREFEPSRGD